ncbi:MAG: hypothetical protein HY279_05070 [Nitrospinae bacterium]|nr:hypothetical protein [Nitrospinota bacterium]
MMIYIDVFGSSVELTDERWLHIMKEHPEVARHKEKIQEVLANPDYAKKSSRDAEVLLYYRFYDDISNGKYMLVVAKKGFRSFILTCYITDTIKKGVTSWEKK